MDDVDERSGILVEQAHEELVGRLCFNALRQQAKVADVQRDDHLGLRLHRPLTHQGLGNKLIEPIPANTNAVEGVVRRRARLGGLLSYYHREAA